MSGTTEKVTGRVKEAAGALADDDKLRNEGKGDQMAGKAKDLADKAIDKVRDVAGRVSDKVEEVKQDIKARTDNNLGTNNDQRDRPTPRI
jgi:uncharacterized protein YjbJ (UPF0337 family)